MLATPLMYRRERLKKITFWSFTLLLVGSGVFVLWLGRVFLERPGLDPNRSELTTSTIPVLMLFGFVLTGVTSTRRPTYTVLARVNRFCSGLGFGLYLFHVAVAFHLAHDWSHAEAFAHVGRQTGFGPGIFVSYLFTLVWGADVAWSWIDYWSYRRRPKWLTWTIGGFLGFVFFNATIVFAKSWHVRVLGLVALLPFLLDQVQRKRSKRAASSRLDSMNGPTARPVPRPK